MSFWDIWIALSIFSALLGAGSLFEEAHARKFESMIVWGLKELNRKMFVLSDKLVQITTSLHNRRSLVGVLWFIFGALWFWAFWMWLWSEWKIIFGYDMHPGLLWGIWGMVAPYMPFILWICLWTLFAMFEIAVRLTLIPMAIVLLFLVSRPERILAYRLSCFSLLIIGQLFQLSYISDVEFH